MTWILRDDTGLKDILQLYCAAVDQEQGTSREA